MADIKHVLDQQVTRRQSLLQLGLALLALLVVSLFLNASFTARSTNTANRTNTSTVGPTGAIGPQGLKGATGAVGLPGATGQTGASGASGVRGATGAKGATGPAAPAVSSPSGPQLTYHLVISDFANSFIEIPTSNVSGLSSTLSSSYLAGTAPIYDANNVQVGTVSATFLSMQSVNGIFTNISDDLSTNDGLVVTWSTPATPTNLQLDSLIDSMATERTVTVATKVGSSTYFGDKYDLVVSSDANNIYFQFNPID